jgi:hypothetical protein
MGKASPGPVCGTPMMREEAAAALSQMDIRARHADGGWRILELNAVDMRSSTEVGGVVWHCGDVTDRRGLEATLRNRRSKTD